MFGKPIKVNRILTNNGNKAGEYDSDEASRVCRYAHVSRTRFDLDETPTSYVLPVLFAVGPGQSCSVASKWETSTRSLHTLALSMTFSWRSSATGRGGTLWTATMEIVDWTRCCFPSLRNDCDGNSWFSERMATPCESRNRNSWFANLLKSCGGFNGIRTLKYFENLLICSNWCWNLLDYNLIL